jgi:pimeloyl-ACP methyl ester carboxylesterase
MPREVQIESESAVLVAVLHGELPAARAALLCHGANWDASGWDDVPRRFTGRGVTVLALNFRGYDGSSGRTNRNSAPIDVRNAAAWLRSNGVRDVALVGASMGGHAVLMASAAVAPDSVVAISAPVRAISEGDAKRILGRKLFVCAERDSLGAASAVTQAYTDAEEPKTLRLFPGREHSKGMFKAKYGDEALELIVGFVAQGLPAHKGA